MITLGDCLQQGRQVSRKTLEAITGCSPNTVRKHSDLWKHFAAGSGVLISGGLGPAAPASSASSELEETGKEIETPVIPDSVTGFSPLSEVSGNDNKPVAASDSTEGKSLFILPYGAQRRPLDSLDLVQVILESGRDAKKTEGSASVPLRQLACSEVLAAAKGGKLKQSRRHNSAARMIYRVQTDTGGS